MWILLKGSDFNKNGQHEGVPVIVWNIKTKLPEISYFYSSCPSKLFSDGTYSHYQIAPKQPQ